MIVKKINNIVKYLILIMFVIILVFPFVWLIINSFKYPADIFGRVTLLPLDKDGNIAVTLQNYIKVIKFLDFPLLFKNTLIVCIVNTFVNLLLNAMAGYAFARMNFKGRDFLFKIVLTSLMIPGTVILVPNMIIIQRLGFYNSLWALILPFLMSIYNVFLMRQHFLSMSKALEESAIIDGANWFQIFLKIALPLAKPIMVILGVFTFIWNYGNFMWPLIVINDTDKFTLSRGLGRLMVGQSITLEKYGMMLAFSVLIAVPLITIFLIFQKSIVQGINVGGVKE